ncbi:ABC transporter permease [Microbispora sp. H10836]|uniref:ABC transporter permease n=1 Tax=Microbispora sp. H10836 TaxID=2729106 RepID=UPI0014755F3B|nr:ABC transporter permease [Microbispora sp. H10836]
MSNRLTQQSPAEPHVQREQSQVLPGTRAPRRFRLERYGTILFFVVFILIVAAIEGTSYASWGNLALVASQNAHVAFVASAVTITLIAGQFDLSAGPLVGMSAVLIAGFTANQGMPLGMALLLVVLIGALVGLVNGLLVTRAKVDAFIATLAVGGAATGVSLLYSGGLVIYTGIPQSLLNAGTYELAGVPLTIWYVAILLVVGWAVTRQTILGRNWYASGANPDAARLAGVKVTRMVVFAFIATGVLSALAGIVLTARMGSSDPTVGPDLLLPAFAAAFLGSSILSDGKFTILGTIIATLLIAFAAAGLDAIGLSAGVKPVFNGAVLVGAVALTALLRRRSGGAGSRA